MEIVTPNNKITYKLLRDIILDKYLTDKHEIVLNTKNFDDIILEYRDFCKESLVLPFKILGITIREAIYGELIQRNRIGIIRADS